MGMSGRNVASGRELMAISCAMRGEVCMHTVSILDYTVFTITL